jgi:hypothetical protein
MIAVQAGERYNAAMRLSVLTIADAYKENPDGSIHIWGARERVAVPKVPIAFDFVLVARVDIEGAEMDEDLRPKVVIVQPSGKRQIIDGPIVKPGFHKKGLLRTGVMVNSKMSRWPFDTTGYYEFRLIVNEQDLGGVTLEIYIDKP